MKILHVIDQVGEQYGGSAMAARKLAKSQAVLGHDVTMYASDAGVDGKLDAVNKFSSFHTVKTLAGSIRITPSIVLADFKNFDMIHCHNYYTFQNMIARFRSNGTPIILQPHGTFVMYDNNLVQSRPTQRIIDYPWRRWFFRKVNTVLCVSNIERAQAVKLGLNVFTVPNGIDMSDYTKLPTFGEFRRKYGIASDEKVILYLGRMDWTKGVNKLLDAYSKISVPARLVIVGAESPSRNGILRLPPMYGRDKLSAFVDADVLVLPSIYEIFGITPLEAMACGTPAIISDRCGLADWCTGEAGEPIISTHDELARKIEAELTSPTKEKYGLERWRFVEKFSWEIIARRVMEVYRELVR